MRTEGMPGEGKYVYCIIGTDEGRHFGPIGIGGRGDEVSTVCHRDLSAVISNTSMAKYTLSRDNLLAHQKVIEKVMRDYTVLPARFCTIASSVQEVRDLLRRRYGEFKGLLQDMDNKVELGVKALWKNMEAIFQEIVDENKEIRSLREKIATRALPEVHPERVRVGKMVKEALEAKKQREGGEIFRLLRRSCVDFRTNELVGDKMLLNAAFLVDRGREKEFDHRMDRLDTQYGERIRFRYVGPTPPYNFVNIVIRE